MSAVPETHSKEEDDLDDLDDVLNEFNKKDESAPALAQAGSSDSSSSVAAPTASGSQAPIVTDDDEGLGEDEDDLLSQQFAKELAEGMEQLMKELTGGAGLPGAPGAPAAEGSAGANPAGDQAQEPALNEEEMMKQFEEMMATMGLGGPTGDSAAPGPSSTASGSRSGPTAPPANYQEALKATMSRLRESDTNASASASGGQDDIAKLLSALGGMGGMEGLGDLDALADSPDMANMLESVMGELMSKSLLYEPMKELAEKYPSFLANPPRQISTEDRARYTQQARIVTNIVKSFDDPKYENGSESEKARLKEQVQVYMNEMQECGAPPDEIVGKMPPGLDGMPGLGPNANPEDCTIM